MAHSRDLFINEQDCSEGIAQFPSRRALRQSSSRLCISRHAQESFCHAPRHSTYI